jgi:hypothetical protein
MTHRAASLRYYGLKMAQAVDVISQQLSSAGGSLPEAIAKGMEAYRRQLTAVVTLAGVAMAPTFNKPRPGRGQDEGLEHLLLRLIPRPTATTVFADDVVAFSRS